jgi:thymidylate synthase ThyX
MSIEAKIIEDSVNERQHRLTTYVLRYPRYIHAEVLTHRQFSRNASSSRAIPVKKIIDSVESDLVLPIHWGKNQKGMQAYEELPLEVQEKARAVWEKLARQAIEGARELSELGVHKQVTNRVLEPYSHISVVLTATDFANFFYLRYHSKAQPEIKELAKKMYRLYKENEPRLVKTFDMMDSTEANDPIVTQNAHLPFVVDSERNLPFRDAIAISQARCARVSYNNHDGTNNSLEKDAALAEDLRKDGHFSPFEHQGLSIHPALTAYKGNFNKAYDWIQIRKMYPNECVDNVPDIDEESADE